MKVARQLYKKVQIHKSEEKVKIFKADSCPEMSGPEGGAAAHLEELLGYALLRIFHLNIFHMIELIYAAFFTYMDPPPPGKEKTAGPDTMRGKIGERLNDPQLRYMQIKNLDGMSNH